MSNSDRIIVFYVVCVAATVPYVWALKSDIAEPLTVWAVYMSALFAALIWARPRWGK